MTQVYKRHVFHGIDRINNINSQELLKVDQNSRSKGHAIISCRIPRIKSFVHRIAEIEIVYQLLPVSSRTRNYGLSCAHHVQGLYNYLALQLSRVAYRLSTRGPGALTLC